MINIFYKYVILIGLVFITGCSVSNHQVAGPQVNSLPEAPPEPAIIHETDSILSLKPFVLDDNQYGSIYNNCEIFGDCAHQDGEEIGVERPLILKSDEVPEAATAEKEEVVEVDEKEKAQSSLDAALEFCNASQEYWSEGNLDKAIATLDEAYSLVLNVKTGGDAELVQQKEDLRFTISKRILEIYASRYTAVNGNHNEIPLTMNEFVEKEIKRFQGPERSFFMESYKRSGKYIDNIMASLKEAGVPEDLAWLPLIESGFKVKALSRARALGLWQFIPSTGYKFGLKRDTWVDERLDPEKATAAAIAYMKELHQIFGDWMTVLAAYNCGEGRVLKRIRDQRINYLDNFWDLYQQLPLETARYVPRFLATLHILKDPAKYGFTLDVTDVPLSYEKVHINKPVHLNTVAGKIGVSLTDLTDLNPELRYKATPASEYVLKVPEGRKDVFLAHVDEITKWTPPKSAYVYHRVRSGETLSLIALRYRTSVSKIVRANNIRRKHFIRVGQKLKIPLRGSSVGTAYASADKLMPGGEYKIKKGDSLWLIARKFKTNTKKLQRINHLQTTRLKVGQVLKIAE